MKYICIKDLSYYGIFENRIFNIILKDDYYEVSDKICNYGVITIKNEKFLNEHFLNLRKYKLKKLL